ncbi:cadherin repeat domain-containing protein [Gammaproteobacteria bacterium]|nr:cadherin repeat domain-containing protein [Gammaproteobacteria bacterium]
MFLVLVSASISAGNDTETLEATSSNSTPSSNIDIDGNEEIDALTDGLLILRSMFGLSGDNLILGAVADDAAYKSSQDLESRISSLGMRLDVDDNDKIDALTDGLVILRHLFGLTGDPLTAGVVADDANRFSAADIESYIRELYILDFGPPIFNSSANFSTFENQKNVGIVAATSDAGSAISYALSGPGKELLNLDSDTGVLAFKTSPDYETKSTYSGFTIIATDGFKYAYQQITIDIIDVNDVAPVFTSTDIFNSNGLQFSIGNITATDADTDDLLITYTLSESELEVTQAGVLSFSTIPGNKNTATYAATVTASDGINSSSQSITVTVSDNDAPVFTSAPSFSIEENQISIGSVTATDLDTDNDLITFSVSGSEIEITSVGELSFLSDPDYETKPSYTATVTATDGRNLATQIITVDLVNVNDNLPVFTSNPSFSLPEDQSPGIKSIGTVVVSDADGSINDDRVTYSITTPYTRGATMSIDSLSGALVFDNEVSYEDGGAQPGEQGYLGQYNINVEAISNGDIVSQDILVQLTNVNEAPVFDAFFNLTDGDSAEIQSPNYTVPESRDGEIGVFVGGFNVWDPDVTEAGVDQGLTYSITGTDMFLDYSTLTGSRAPAIAFTSERDYETQSSYLGTLTVSDGEYSVVRTITVTIIDVDDEAPVFSCNVINTCNTSAAENQTAIGTMTATDVDTDNSLITFTVSGSELLMTSGGVLSFASAPDYETKSAYTATVTATDGCKSTTQNITVSVTDADDSAPVFSSSSSFSAAENQIAIGTVTATDVDTDNGLITFTVSGSELLMTSGGVLSFASAPDYETKSAYTATVTATDGFKSTTQNITVSVTDANDSAPVFISSSSFSAREDQIIIGRVTATDEDTDNGLITFTVSGSELVITPEGLLSFASVPDYEVKSSYTATMTATDGTNSSTQSITVSVDRVNLSSPVFTSSSSFSAAENQTSIGTIVASDGDDDTLSYSLSGADASSMSINTSTGVLSFLTAPDFEIKTSYSITVNVSDGTDVVAQAVTVNITNVNDNDPVISSTSSFSIDENQLLVGSVFASDVDGDTLTYNLAGTDAASLTFVASNTLVFSNPPNYENKFLYSVNVEVSDGVNSVTQSVTVNIMNVNDNDPVFLSLNSFSIPENQASVGTVFAKDADGDTLNYSLSDGDANSFEINAVSGLITFTDSPNYESKNTYEVTVRATEESAEENHVEQKVLINVTDTNEFSPIITTSVFTVAENQTAVGTVLATDEDVSDTLTYSLTGADASSFNMDGSSGTITFKTAPDYEVKPSYSIEINVSDGINTVTQAVTVNVTNVNESSPSLNNMPSLVSVDENQTDVITATATDDDISETLTFSLVGPDASSFTIDSSSGRITFLAAPDYETKVVYAITVGVTDGTNSSSHALTISINNLNDNEPIITSESYFNIDENQTSVGSIIARDPDGDEVLYTITGTDAGAFNIGGSSGFLSFKNAPDYESENTYQFTVRVAEQNNADAQVTQNITVNVNNVNEFSPVITSSSAFTVLENEESIGSIIASDGDGDTLNYRLAGGDASSMDIGPSTGVLSFVDRPDYESKSTYVTSVDVSDGVNTVSQTLTINILNTNDTCPQLVNDPNMASCYREIAIAVPEYTTDIMSFTVTDIDSAISSFTYGDLSPSILLSTSGDYNEFGVLSFKNAPDFEDPQDNDSDSNNNVYDIRLFISDGQKITQRRILVSITDVDEGSGPYFVSPYFYNVAENQTAVGEVMANDPDGDNITFSLWDGRDASSFVIDSSSGIIAFKTAPNYEEKSSYSVIVQATDGINTQDHVVTVNVMNVNEFTPSINDLPTSVSVDENQAAVITVVASDADTSEVLEFYLTGADASLLNINSNSGVITFNSPPDHETKAAYSVIVNVSDGTNTDTQAITVNVVDVNENPTITSASIFSAPENQVAVGTVSANDVDGDSISFSLSGTDASSFDINSDSGVISFLTAPDHETKSLYSIMIIASDGTNSDSQAVTIVVSDVNESPIITSAALFEAFENQTVVGSVTADDVDGDNVIFSLGGSDGSLFTINSNSGAINFVSTPDYETKTSYSISINATDGSYTATQVIMINVINVNDVSPVITSESVFSVEENQEFFAFSSATDPEGDSLTYSLGGADAALAFIDDSSANINVYKLRLDSWGSGMSGGRVDYEKKSQYLLDLIVSDGINVATQAITINVIDINEGSPLFDIRSDDFTSWWPARIIAENENMAITTKRMIVRDRDGDPLTVSIVGDDADLFNFTTLELGVNEVEISLTLKNIFDYENPQDQDLDNIYDISVNAKDDNGGDVILQVYYTVENESRKLIGVNGTGGSGSSSIAMRNSPGNYDVVVGGRDVNTTDRVINYYSYQYDPAYPSNIYWGKEFPPPHPPYWIRDENWGGDFGYSVAISANGAVAAGSPRSYVYYSGPLAEGDASSRSGITGVGDNVKLSDDGWRLAILGKGIAVLNMRVYPFEVIAQYYGDNGDLSSGGMGLSNDGERVAFMSENGENDPIRIYQGDTQIGQGIIHEFNTSFTDGGKAIELNEDGSIVAIASPVKVYKYNEGSDQWEQLGGMLEGSGLGVSTEGDILKNGGAIDLSDDGYTVAIGSPLENDGDGAVRIYDWNGSTWDKRGDDILPPIVEQNLDGTPFFGKNLTLSGDGKVIAITSDAMRSQGSDTLPGSFFVYDIESNESQ